MTCIVRIFSKIFLSCIICCSVYAQQSGAQQAMVFFWAEDVENPGLSNWRPLGSGLLVSKEGVILTAKHVISNTVTGERVVVSNSDKSRFPVAIDETDILCAMANRDVCAVRVPQGAVPASIDEVFALECGALGVGTKLRAMGFTGGADPFGGVIQPSGEVIGSAMRAGLIPTDLSLVPTMSGGPVFNSKGNVVGLVKGADSSSNNLTFVTPVTSIKPIVESLNIGCDAFNVDDANRARLESELETLQEIASEVQFSITHQNLRVIPALNIYRFDPARHNWNEVVHTVSVVHQRLERAIELEIDFATSLDTDGGSQQVAALLQTISSAGQNLDNLENRQYRTNLKSKLIRDLAQGHSSRSVTCLLYTSPSPRDLSTSRMPSSA